MTSTTISLRSCARCRPDMPSLETLRTCTPYYHFHCSSPTGTTDNCFEAVHFNEGDVYPLMQDIIFHDYEGMPNSNWIRKDLLPRDPLQLSIALVEKVHLDSVNIPYMPLPIWRRRGHPRSIPILVVIEQLKAKKIPFHWTWCELYRRIKNRETLLSISRCLSSAAIFCAERMPQRSPSPPVLHQIQPKDCSLKRKLGDDEQVDNNSNDNNTHSPK